MKLKKYNQLFEADIKDNKGIPKDYIDGVEQKGREKYGYNGPNREEFGEMMSSLNNVFRIQNQGDNKEKLTEIGKEIILNHYAEILDGVELDIKIVEPNDTEKKEMTEKMDDGKEGGESEEDGNTFETEIDQDEVDKRKILNNLMQGEAQNVHGMMYESKDKIDDVNDTLLNLYSRVLEINKKFDWFDDAMMMENPEMASCNECEFGEDEEGEPTVGIKVRALDLPMLIHETVKGIYELIMANAIPEDSVLAKRIMDETDTIRDEKQDIKFGPFIASDIRDFFTKHIEKTTDEDIQNIKNLREFIYAKMASLEASVFIELISAILSDESKAVKILKEHDIIHQSILDARGETEGEDSRISWEDDDHMEYDGDHDDDHDEIVNMMKSKHNSSEEDEMLKPKERTYADMSKSELDEILNQALDDDDFETMNKIKPFL